MKNRALVCLMAALIAAHVHAGPTEKAIADAMKLPDARNYSWITDVVDDARSYTIDGKTDLADNKDFSLVTMPMVGAIRRGMSRGGGTPDSQTTALFKGDEKFVIETPEGWKKADELTGGSGSRGYRGRSGGGYGGYGGSRGGYGGRRGGMSGRDGTDGRGGLPYSNLQQTLSRPHEEIAILIAGYTELKAETDGVSGTLSDTNAKLLLVHAGQKELTPVRATGTFRLWFKEGELVKYEVKLDGAVAVNTSSGRREIEVHQTATTMIRDVGTTKFEVPEAAKKKLGA